METLLTESVPSMALQILTRLLIMNYFKYLSVIAKTSIFRTMYYNLAGIG